MQRNGLVALTVVAAAACAPAAAQDGFGRGFDFDLPGLSRGIAPVPGIPMSSGVPSFGSDGLGATSLGGFAPGLGIGQFGSLSPGGAGTGIGLGGSLDLSSAFGTSASSFGSFTPDSIGTPINSLPFIGRSGGSLLGSSPGSMSTGMLDFLTEPSPFDPFLSDSLAGPPSVGVGVSSSSAATFGGRNSFADEFCRPEDFTC